MIETPIIYQFKHHSPLKQTNMKKFSSVLFVLIMIRIAGFGQQCLPDGIEITSQAVIDNFSTTYPDCTEIEGLVTIHGSDISNLNGLSAITSFRGGLSVYGTQTLTNLAGLDNVTHIDGPFTIWTSDGLTSLSGIGKLQSVSGDLEILSNNQLTDLSGFDELTSIGGLLRIGNNSSLQSLTGLGNLGDIGGDLLVYINNNLLSMDGLNQLDSIGGSLSIAQNAGLKSFNGLEDLKVIGNGISIESNEVLLGLMGIENIQAASIHSLLITGNPALSSCEVKSVCDYLALPDATINIAGNATGCNSQTEVQVACTSGLHEAELKSDWSLFPNPAENEVAFTLEPGTVMLALAVYNQLGQCVLAQQGVSLRMDIAHLQPGTYVVELTTANGKSRQRLVVR